MFFTIYKITNIITGKFYIGKHKTSDLEDGYMGSGKLIRRAILKHGPGNFKKEYLFVFDNEQDMDKKESELVTEEFCLRDDNYNLCRGGAGGFSYVNRTKKNLYGANGENGKVALEKAHKILSEYRESADFCKKVASAISQGSLLSYASGRKNGFMGKCHSDATKNQIGETISAAQTGAKNSQFGTMWITDGTTNKKIKKTDSIPSGWKRGRKMTNC